MIIVYPSYHVRHRPPVEIVNGNRDPHADVPERIEQIKSALESLAGVRCVLPRRFPRSWIERVHDTSYIDYLTASGRLAGNEYVYPSVFPYGFGQQTKQDIGKRGQYSFDTYTPVSSSTYKSAHGSAMAALTAASLVRRGEWVVYALCRPPGHHAEQARMGGYCYLNNCAIAAEYLATRGRVAILDIDVHHGNGTQDIFYSRADVLVVNIHANPDERFPYFTGRAEETGMGDGTGYNHNLPLPLKTSDIRYDESLSFALRKIQSFSPKYLVVSVGYDTHISDPIGGFCLSTGYFLQIARSISTLRIPTVLIQEGGYDTEILGEIAKTFVRGFM